MQHIFHLKMGEQMTYKGKLITYIITRVPGGWVFLTTGDMPVGTFVPLETLNKGDM
jgi:hypothetical protein